MSLLVMSPLLSAISIVIISKVIISFVVVSFCYVLVLPHIIQLLPWLIYQLFHLDVIKMLNFACTNSSLLIGPSMQGGYGGRHLPIVSHFLTNISRSKTRHDVDSLESSFY